MLSTKTSGNVEIMHGVSEHMCSCNCMEKAIDIIDDVVEAHATAADCLCNHRVFDDDDLGVLTGDGDYK